MSTRLLEIGQRLRAYRLGAGLSADALGRKLNMSRASIYRLETEGSGRIDTLARVAALLGVSLETLLGVGVEYVPSAIAYFERLRQIEATTDQVFAAFGPLLYLLTSDAYDNALREALAARTHASLATQRLGVDLDEVMSILAARKAQYRLRQFAVTNVLAVPELLRFRAHGLVDEDQHLPAAVLRHQRAMVEHELERIAQLLETPPLGVQLGIVLDALPSTSFSVLRQADHPTVAISPFRLGPLVNVWRGVAMISRAPEAVKLHGQWAQSLWGEALTGQRAADYVRRRIAAPSPAARSSAKHGPALRAGSRRVAA